MLEINTLSSPEIVVGDEKVVNFVSRKALALVVYLAVNPGSCSREELADLLWSDYSQERATGNLRVVLSDVRKKIGDYLYIDRHSVSIQTRGDIWVDVHQLLGAIENNNLELAISLYRGDFLESFYLRGASRFENWQVVEREKIRLELVDGLSEAVQSLLKAGNSKEAIKYLVHLTALEPLLESAHRRLMQAYYENGEISLALKQFEICKQTLREELSVIPAEDTLKLYAHIAGHRSPVTLADTIPHNLPIFTTPFVGQTEKSHELVQLLSMPEVRHLSLIGPGGYGKSRLAIQLAKKCFDQFPDGVFWVPLQSLEESSELPVAIADAIGFIPQTEKDIKSALLEYLSSRQTLLVLDNFEHLLAGAKLIFEILTASQYIKIITTSRQKLNLKGETLYIVRGMDYPVGDELASGKLSAKKFDAVQLFVKSAVRSNPSFKPDVETLVMIGRICRMVDGMPLAIELAAGWVPVLLLDEIEAEISKGFGFLEGKLQDVEERHHSLRAVAGQSWSMLAQSEKVVFKKLSIFKGPFTKKAAEKIAGANINDLLSLSNKSFLQKDSEGLLRIHEWLRQFGEGELRKSRVEFSESLESFSNYYLTYLSESNWEAWSGDCQRLRLEWRNISEALFLTTRTRNFQLLGKALVPYSFAASVMGDLYESNILLSKIVAEFERREISDIEHPTYALCLAFHAYFLDSQNRSEQAIKTYEKVKKIIQGHGPVWEYAWCRVMENVTGHSSDWEKLCESAKTALEIFEELQDEFAVTFVYNQIANYSFGDTKRKYCQKALANATKYNGIRDLAWALMELGLFETDQGNFKKAEKLLAEAYSHYISIHFSHGIVRVSRFMGVLALKQKKYTQAKAYYERAFRLCDRVGFKGYATLIKYFLGAVAFEMQEYDLARQLFLDAYQQDINSFGDKLPMERTSNPEIPMLLERLGYPDLAVIRLVVTSDLPYEENWKPQNEQLLEELKSRYSQEEIDVWIEKAQQIKPIELVIAIRDALSDY